MSNKNRNKLIKKMAIDNFSRYVDECIEEYLFLSKGRDAPAFEEVEDIWDHLLEQNRFNVSQLMLNLVSSSGRKDLILEYRKRVLSSFDT